MRQSLKQLVWRGRTRTAQCGMGFLGLAIVLAMVAAVIGDAHAETRAPKRIVSINVCADQLLLALAQPSQIAALTHYANDRSMSYYRQRAEGIRQITGSAEEVLKLKPDLVLAGRFTRRETRSRLAAFGIRVEVLRPARSLEDVRALISQVGGLVGSSAAARKAVSDFDAALEGASRAAVRLRILQLQRRGFVAGQGTLFNSMIAHLGADNAVGLNQRSVRRMATEALVKLRPDAVVMFASDLKAQDQGAALIVHPALRRTLSADRLIVLPMNTIVCGGPQNVAAIRALERSLMGIAPRT